MKRYTKVYFKHFGYGECDFIPCEICGDKAVDIAHIYPKSSFGAKRKEEQDDISNLAALCRSCHYDYDFNNRWTRQEMFELHRKFLESSK